MDGHPERHQPVAAVEVPEKDETSHPTVAPDLGSAIGIMVSETGGALAGVGLTHGQFVLLLAVSELEPVPSEMLGRIMAFGERRSDVELAPLIDKGALQLRDQDTSECLVVTTAHGRNLLQRAIPLWEAAQDRIQDRLGVGRS
jgi:hypothetical protein